jgi:hypothetical protein
VSLATRLALRATTGMPPATRHASRATGGPLPATSGSLPAATGPALADNPKNSRFSQKSAVSMQCGTGDADQSHERFQRRGCIMAKDFVPRRDDKLAEFSKVLSDQLNTSYARYGLDESDAVEYAGLVAAFAEALAVLNIPATHTTPATCWKNDCRVRLVKMTRDLNRRIQAHPNTTDSDRASLGLTIPKSNTVEIGRPDHAPLLAVDSINIRTVRIRLRNQLLSTRRGRPESCAGASIYWFAGEVSVPPTEPGTWTYLCGVTRTIAKIRLPSSLTPGTKVFLCAAWYNAKAEQGNGSMPVSVRVQDGVEPRNAVG